MAEIDYRPFDYFSTNMFYIDIDWSEIDKYGVTKDEVEIFLEVMEKDRKAWEKKWNAIDNWGVVLNFFVSLVVIPLVALLVASYMGHNYDMDNIIPSTIFNLFLAGCIILEVLIWTKYRICDLIVEWGTLYYKRKSQDKPIIEKFIEDCNWKQWQKYNMDREVVKK